MLHIGNKFSFQRQFEGMILLECRGLTYNYLMLTKLDLEGSFFLLLRLLRADSMVVLSEVWFSVV